MNLFQIIHDNHRESNKRTDIKTITNWINDSRARSMPCLSSNGALRIERFHVALILSWAGNVDGCLSPRDYDEYCRIINLAQTKMTAAPSATQTKTFTNCLANAASCF